MAENGVARRGKGGEKWSTLRNAFLSAVAASKTGSTQSGGEGEGVTTLTSAKSASATAGRARFEGFVLFPSRHEQKFSSPPATGSALSAKQDARRLVSATYHLPLGKKVMTREAPCVRRGERGGAGRPAVTLDQLFAHRVHGVDNTGNVRVWPAEQVLLHVLLSGPLASSLAGTRVLELGAGMSGLAGLGLAACTSAAEVVITDGNPDALENLEACVELNDREGVFGDTKAGCQSADCDSLTFPASLASSRHGRKAERLGFSGVPVVRSLASFRYCDFHEDLIHTIRGLLKPSGRAVFVQPQRGGTVDLFLERVAAAAAASAAKVGGQDGGAAVQQLPPQAGRQAQLWVAVAGAPGSGKTTLAAEVCRRVHSAETPAVCIPMDGYHLYRRELDLLPDPSEAHRKRGAHWTFDGTRFLREIREARTSGAGSFPGFDHARGDPVESQWAVDPSHAVVLVEGNYLLLKGVDPWDAAGELFDETWAIRCPPEVCGERVRKRHVQTGLGDQEALDRVKDNDLPNARLVSERCPWDEVDVVIDSL
ncbi:unnamed protein product [Scytosiphon promiscuus]